MPDNIITLLNNISRIWANYFSLMFIQSTIFLILVFAVLFMLRRRNARFLYIISILGLIKLFIPPVFILNAGFDPAYKVSSLLGMNSFYKSNADLAGNFPEMMVIQQEPVLTIFSLALLTWLAAIFVYILINIYKYAQLKKALGYLTRVDITGSNNLKTSIFKSEKSHSPLVLGYFKHKIIVPKNWDLWSDECRKSVLEHEIAHIKNKDSWTCIMELIAQALYIFNPAVWLLCKKVDRYREMSCDDTAVEKLNLSHINYSKSLIHITESVRDYDRVVIKTAFLKTSGEFKKRILYQLSKQDTKINSRLLSVPVYAVLILMIFPFSMNTTAINYKSQPSVINTDYIRKNILESKKGLKKIFEEDFIKSHNLRSGKESDILIYKTKSVEKDIIYRVNKGNIDKP